jgi:hypothetical protein
VSLVSVTTINQSTTELTILGDRIHCGMFVYSVKMKIRIYFYRKSRSEYFIIENN